MPDSEPSGESVIRERLRALIEDGVLPRVRPTRVWAGPCREDHRCVACGATIAAGETEFDLVLPAGVKLFLHPGCINLWPRETEREEREGLREITTENDQMTRCALCRTPIRPTASSRTVPSVTYHAGCWDRKVRSESKQKPSNLTHHCLFGRYDRGGQRRRAT